MGRRKQLRNISPSRIISLQAFVQIQQNSGHFSWMQRCRCSHCWNFLPNKCELLQWTGFKWNENEVQVCKRSGGLQWTELWFFCLQISYSDITVFQPLLSNQIYEAACVRIKEPKDVRSYSRSATKWARFMWRMQHTLSSHNLDEQRRKEEAREWKRKISKVSSRHALLIQIEINCTHKHEK